MKSKKLTVKECICHIIIVICGLAIIGLVDGVSTFNESLTNLLWCIPLFGVIWVAAVVGDIESDEDETL
jgi:hypothetical protein